MRKIHDSDHGPRFSYANHARAWIAAAIILFSAAGCVTEVEKPLAQTALFTTRVGEEVTLSWKSKIGEQYSLWYAETRDANSRWNVLPGCERINGTGENIQKTDQVPAGVQRYYRIIIAPAKK